MNLAIARKDMLAAAGHISRNGAFELETGTALSIRNARRIELGAGAGYLWLARRGGMLVASQHDELDATRH